MASSALTDASDTVPDVEVAFANRARSCAVTLIVAAFTVVHGPSHRASPRPTTAVGVIEVMASPPTVTPVLMASATWRLRESMVTVPQPVPTALRMSITPLSRRAVAAFSPR